MRLINRHPGAVSAAVLGLIPFLLIILAYSMASRERLAENPNDKLLPGLEQMVTAMERMAFQEDRRSGDYLLWTDTFASLERLGIGISVAAVLALTVGILNGTLPLVRAGLAPLVSALSMIPPLAILPILFIVFGLGELSKVMLIVIGTAPIMMRDVAQRVRELPQEQFIKIQTLGANTWQMVTRMVLPQVLPRLIDSVRLSLGPAWLFLIAAEAISSTEGLGYRIFLVRRFLSMDVILPYVLWITLLAIVIDQLLRLANRRLFPWYNAGGN
ncbi:ABC transporter permease [uncultured Marinobacter sp.]|uniref:ABC transporter permease n=1 Tax=uncultured Marinobacter sp. TaxID=187379 RepID=UPI0030D6DBBA